MNPKSIFISILDCERQNIFYYLVLCFVAGCAFYLFFTSNTDIYFGFLIIIFGALIILFSFNYQSLRGVSYLFWLIFILGIFYAKFYVINYAKNSQFENKLFVKGVGKVILLKKFYNPVNRLYGTNAILEVSQITKLQNFVGQKSAKKINPPKKKTKKIKKTKSKKIKTNKKLKKEKDKTKQSKKKAKKPKKKISKSFAKKIYKNYANLANYQEIDRQYLDFKNNYNNGLWVKRGNDFVLLNPPRKISLNLANSANLSTVNNFKINDEILFYAVLEPVSTSDFPENYNFKFDALAKKIDAFGFFLQPPTIIKANNIDSVEAWFNGLREIIRHKILQYLDGDPAGIVMALLIGDQNYIPKNTLSLIRNSGLAHLLSISGFHLSFASGIFFVVMRFLLVRINFIALRFDIKKISAVFAILASYFYLKIAGSPLPAKRALIIVWVVMLGVLFDKKFDNKRALFLALLTLTILNPYSLFQVGFLLSFFGVLVVITYIDKWRKKIFIGFELRLEANFITDILSKVKLYFAEIAVITFAIQIVTLPILMNNFQSFSLSGFGANLMAIPLVSFVILPFVFLALLLMLLKIEFVCFWLIELFLKLFIKIIYFFAELKYAVVATPLLANHLLVYCILSSSIFLTASHRYLHISMLVVFVFAIASSFMPKSNHIILEKSQKFYAFYQDGDLFFSQKIKLNKQIKSWLKTYNQSNLRVIKNCDNVDLGRDNSSKNCQQCSKNFCILRFDKIKILILKKRNNIKHLCQKYRQNNIDAVVNFTKKFQLPSCIKNDKPHKIIIDNVDFLSNKTFIFKVRDDKLVWR